jgi:leader peptidase (prepilin peptidase) / N-methyltransferase
MDSWVLPFFIFWVGCCIGSFLNVCVYRLPQNISIVSPRSFCPQCRASIRAYYNIPLLSYFLLHGKCRNCGAEIPWRYPFVEGLSGALALALFWKFGLSFIGVTSFALTAALIVISFIDLDHRIIPDVISIPGIIIGFLLALFGGPVLLKDSLIGLAVGGGSLLAVAFVYEKLTQREGMGMGDVKLLAMIGAWLGWPSVLFTIFFASLSGTIIGGTVMWASKKGRHYAIPFGPFLAFSAMAYIFIGPELIQWYLGLGRA